MSLFRKHRFDQVILRSVAVYLIKPYGAQYENKLGYIFNSKQMYILIGKHKGIMDIYFNIKIRLDFPGFVNFYSPWFRILSVHDPSYFVPSYTYMLFFFFNISSLNTLQTNPMLQSNPSYKS